MAGVTDWLSRDLDQISMTEASARGIARIAREASEGNPVAIARHKHPVAVVVDYWRYRELLEHAARGATRPRPTVFGPPQG